MADNQEKSDDLIAELAKLMASNAQGSENESKPGVIKLTPLGETTAAAGSTPLRIPGMEAPKPAAPATVTAAPAARVGIPGMDSPGAGSRPGANCRACSARAAWCRAFHGAARDTAGFTAVAVACRPAADVAEA